MQIKTLLNRLDHHKGFVYERVVFDEKQDRLEVRIRPRKNGRTYCSICRRQAPLYDTQKERTFQFVPLWNIAVVLIYTMRRVRCSRCGVRVEYVPWALGKTPVSRALALFLASWARRLSWKEVADSFGVGWPQVRHAVEFVVEYGLKNRVMQAVSAIGIDEVAYGYGQTYMTLVYQLCGDTRRLLYVGRERTTASLQTFFLDQGVEWCAGIRFVCTDMWAAYRKAIEKSLPVAVHILDRFHIVALLNKAVDEVRREERSRLKREGYEDVLKHTKYCFLKNPENLTDKQELKLADILKYDLRSVRAYRLREAFQMLWAYSRPYWARWHLRKWCASANRSKLKPIKRFVKTVRKHEDLILNWFEAKKLFSSGAVEGMNRKINLITRRAYGFKSFDTMRIALFHTLGDLPEPEMTHRFC